MSENLKASNNNNVRQLGSSSQSTGGQNQILSALDTLGAKLVRSEAERETMRKLLNEALEAQDRLETQIERSQIHIQRRIDQMEDKDGAALSEEDKAFIQEQKHSIEATKESLEEQLKRQTRVEDKMRDAQQTIQKLQRRLDAAEQKRAKLQRRVERVENIAADAQNALEAKAIVLLTDQSEQVRELQNIQALQTQQAMRAIDNLHSAKADIIDNDVVDQAQPWHKVLRNQLSQSGSVLAVLVALGLGWTMAGGLDNSSPQTFVLTENGQLARLESQEQSRPAMDMAAVQQQSEAVNASDAQSIPETAATSIEDELTILSTDWVTQTVLDEAILNEENSTASPFDMIETVSTAEITMDKDLTLPEDIQTLEEQAFSRIPEAQHDLAALYTSGQAGVTQNYERASFWFRLAAEGGIANAAYNLGVLFQQGLGQEQDLQRALDWYRRAAQLGHPEAQYNLGIAYIEGVGTRYNPALAAAFFQQAAFAGIVEAAYNLGLILENGLLGEVRVEDALIWYRGAAENGSTEAQLALQTLASNLSIPVDQAGYLESGESLSQYLTPLKSIEPAAGGIGEPLFEDARGDISLGTLIPTDEQILVAQIQEQLRKNRLYNGPQDGIVGAGTLKAIQTYQRQHELPVDGKATPELFTYMLKQGTE